ncbi:G-type lectin S-receptor-like serine/threonine-protein kinase At1g61480 isoform X2 [Cannabis sativa]|uniref:G-type lectin S-receptor-like serine/threonine-protein kinase At1g61480 isoform X2 n=1 Tax=Cannabis sativa TaxID=3483 RepID=UPI0029C9BBD2|nr:G-type lectin S-receptor-like serine/threonine-protein kinase At1g61480 isoform X2 [Cannabis sativa]
MSMLNIFLLSFFWFQSQYCYAIYNITSSQALSQTQTLLSSNQTFELGFFNPNNSANQYVGIWYKDISPRTVVWVANREKPLKVADSASASLTIGSNGNLELLSGKNKSVIWSTYIPVRSNGSIVELSDNGNLVLKDEKTGENLWQSFQHLGDTFLPGATLGYNLKTGANYVLTSWKSDNDPSPGNFTLGISKQLPPQVYLWINGKLPYWRSGPWDKSKFVGVPDMDTSYQSFFILEQDFEKETAFLHFNLLDQSLVTKAFVSSQGLLRLFLHNKYNVSGSWYPTWEGGTSRCDVYGTCGEFGVCTKSQSPICKCLKGFVPKSDQEWRGCKRRTDLLCGKNNISQSSNGRESDGFYKMSMIKLPDLYTFVNIINANNCYKWCMNNCSCVAYAFVNGIGCLVWSEDLIDIQGFSNGGEDLFIRLAQADLVGGHKSRKTVIILAFISGSALLVIVAIAFIFKRWRTNHRTESQLQNLKSAKQQDPSELCIFELDTVLAATNHFNITNKLGQGGFGSVYKGKLQDGKEIAIKRLSSSSGQGIEELKNEMILISKLQHRNLVKLLGCCIEGEEKLLIYEFMPNRSLDTFLFDRSRSVQLNWATRFNIIHGIARGLVYLHRDSCLRVIHRDLKVSNILLDEKMNPKISDFGLARIFEETIDLVNTQRVVGTLGYMSPEYAMGGIFSEKSDVFSFGMMVLEIISGKKNSSFHYYEKELSLVDYAWQLWNESRGLDLVDDALAKSYSAAEAMRCIHIGLLCVQYHASDRPTMVDVVSMLIKETHLPQPKQSFFTCQRQPQAGTSSVNEVTLSLFEGR